MVGPIGHASKCTKAASNRAFRLYAVREREGQLIG